MKTAFRNIAANIQDINQTVREIEILQNMNRDGIRFVYDEDKSVYVCPFCQEGIADSYDFGKHLVACYMAHQQLNVG